MAEATKAAKPAMHYELTYIIRPDVPTTQIDAVATKLTDLVKKHKGKVAKAEQWGLRPLAYPINKHKKGYYTMLGLTLNGGEGLPELENQLKLSDDVIRFMSVKVAEHPKEPSAMLKAKTRGAEGDDFAAPASL